MARKKNKYPIYDPLNPRTGIKVLYNFGSPITKKEYVAGELYDRPDVFLQFFANIGHPWVEDKRSERARELSKRKVTLEFIRTQG